jgi:hypothetical protein
MRFRMIGSSAPFPFMEVAPVNVLQAGSGSSQGLCKFCRLSLFFLERPQSTPDFTQRQMIGIGTRGIICLAHLSGRKLATGAIMSIFPVRIHPPSTATCRHFLKMPSIYPKPDPEVHHSHRNPGTIFWADRGPIFFGPNFWAGVHRGLHAGGHHRHPLVPNTNPPDPRPTQALALLVPPSLRSSKFLGFNLW